MIATAQYDSLSHGNYNRTYLLHLPAGYTGLNPLPLVVAMHGGFGNAYSMQATSQLSLKADAENFVVVYPEGVKGGFLNASSWNAGWCCGFASNTAVDDVGFIEVLLDSLSQQYAIDSNRIYVTGMSNGGFMTYRLACELSNRIAAIAPVAASMSISNCSPLRPVPVINFHSYLDTHIPYSGGIGNGPSSHYNLPQDSVINTWAAINSCTVPQDTLVNNSNYTLVKWRACNCSSEIHHYATQDGGHSWPGGPQTASGDPSSSAIDATHLIWSFFQQHTLNCSNVTPIRTNNTAASIIQFYPNPTKGKLRATSNLKQNLEIVVFNAVGEKVAAFKNSLEIDLSRLEKGVYFIQTKTTNQIYIDKIVKID
ncbi:extracellular catalytic domain type 1 short-chain-length polyhydroxyalkanoate depolymerase [Aureispira anguillae]|uniref:T9SS type A sorting domain-containing protein n=1 Tax=Aureispira anguillae TaxID=2864201 RepID=A0A915YDD5_9BACT|nr:PHB depolymerase family esterase [Aureispira anguillae]BDS11008.1 T9SS type A sorting domain-containing protein [Aureispira anguillae]